MPAESMLELALRTGWCACGASLLMNPTMRALVRACCRPPLTDSGEGGSSGEGGGLPILAPSACAEFAEAVQHLTRHAAQRPSLRRLNLSQNFLGDSGVLPLAHCALPCLHNLELLELSCANLKTAGVLALAAFYEAAPPAARCTCLTSRPLPCPRDQPPNPSTASPRSTPTATLSTLF